VVRHAAIQPSNLVRLQDGGALDAMPLVREVAGGGLAAHGEIHPSGRELRRIMLTPKQVSEQIGVSDSLVYEWCAQRLLPHFRFGRQGKRGKVLIEQADLDAFLAAHRQEAKPTILPLKHIQMGHG